MALVFVNYRLAPHEVVDVLADSTPAGPGAAARALRFPRERHFRSIERRERHFRAEGGSVTENHREDV